IDVVRQVLEAGLLGEVHTVIADHGLPAKPDPPHRLFAPELAGGALLDLGIYPVSFASMVLGPFTSVAATGTKAFTSVAATGTKAFTGVDGQASVVITNAAGAHAVLNTTLFARTPTTASIAGTRARLEIEGDFYAPATIRLVSREAEVLDSHVPAQRGGGLCYEAAEAARCIAAGRLESDLMPLEETLRIMRALDEIRGDLGITYPGEHQAPPTPCGAEPRPLSSAARSLRGARTLHVLQSSSGPQGPLHRWHRTHQLRLLAAGRGTRRRPPSAEPEPFLGQAGSGRRHRHHGGRP
ncbi:hypothetical protein AB0427_32615, partial [Streptomyces sp. NPDC088744]